MTNFSECTATFDTGAEVYHYSPYPKYVCEKHGEVDVMESNLEAFRDKNLCAVCLAEFCTKYADLILKECCEAKEVKNDDV